ncbi:MAG TPA: hypothetical protein VFV95_00340 [Vicinamibacterales bacterium]|nr:hypothetical protein [Vicinamibacterales bacterium]
MFRTLRATAATSCPLCGRSTAPASDSTSVVAWYTCSMCGHEWSARIRNGQPDERPSDVFRQELTHLERP